MHQAPTMIPHVTCPVCHEHVARIDHLYNVERGTTFTWWCHNAACRHEYTWRQHDDGSLDIAPTGRIHDKTAVLLKLGPLTEPLYLIIDGIDSDDADHHRYFYEEHTCPTNIMRAVQEIWFGEDECDPHGVFRFLKCIRKPADEATLADFTLDPSA